MLAVLPAAARRHLLCLAQRRERLARPSGESIAFIAVQYGAATAAQLPDDSF